MLVFILISGCTETNNEQSNGNADKNNNETNQSNNQEENNGGGEESEEASFTEHMFELDKVNYIVPLGELEGGWEEMEVNNIALVHIKRTGEYPSPSMTMEVYAPTDMSLNLTVLLKHSNP